MGPQTSGLVVSGFSVFFVGGVFVWNWCLFLDKPLERWMYLKLFNEPREKKNGLTFHYTSRLVMVY